MRVNTKETFHTIQDIIDQKPGYQNISGLSEKSVFLDIPNS
jgi:hypothetical protein